MKVLLFLNGPKGCQTGIEDGFSYLKESGYITDIKWMYFEEFYNGNIDKNIKNPYLYFSEPFNPDLIIFFHISSYKISKEILIELKSLPRNPILVYDEGDMYGTWAKHLTKSIKVFLKNVDIVSVRGLGNFYKKILKFNKNIIYTPHHNDIARYISKNEILKKEKVLVFIGNRLKPRFLSSIRRLPGAKGREDFVKYIGENFPNKFSLFGNGWSSFIGNEGSIDFYEQNRIYENTTITVAYEHYPNIPYYFSNRLPMALMNGSLYVCHYHKGYENIFPTGEFIFFFEKNSEAIDIINFLLSLSSEELKRRSDLGKAFAFDRFHPNVIWKNFYLNILSNAKQNIGK